MPGPGGDAKRPDEEIDGPLEDAASVLREPVDLARSLLDDAELGTEEVPPALVESAEVEHAADEAEEAIEAETVLAPPPRDQDGGVIDPEELEERLEAAAEPAELLSLHNEDPLSEALLDEGTALDEFEDEDVQNEVERLAEQSGEDERVAPRARRRVMPPPGRGPEAPAGEIDAERFRRLLEADRARLESLKDEFEREGLRRRSEQEDLSSLSAVDQHPADLGTETFDRERDLSIRDQVEGELAEVTRAMQRLDDGMYGRCEACGRPIGVDRLAAEPATRFCLNDQRELERELAIKHLEVEL
jgi:RNA polymerase-binding transcription factor DksA